MFDTIIQIKNIKLEMIIMSNLHAQEYKYFEEIKKVREDGTEYWNARELSKILQYTEWRNFLKVLERAKLSC
jgi:DNA-damage-inducible protein D